ncbi:hypothetical protein ACEPAH_10 [Sanghuangporus vaninii]
MRPFNVYVHPDFSYQPYESYHGSNVHPSRRIALALVLISAGAALAVHRYAPDALVHILNPLGLTPLYRRPPVLPYLRCFSSRLVSFGATRLRHPRIRLTHLASFRIIIHHHNYNHAVPGTFLSGMPNPYSGEPKCLVMTNAPDIEITGSDSDPSKVPKTVMLGQQELQRADKEHQVYWRDTIAMYVMHEGRFWPGLKSDSTFKMTKLPAGYGLYVSTRPKGEQDYYLYGFKSNGSHGVAFRSPAEFALHAKWLAFGCPEGACECKYCSRTSQKVIATRLKAATKGAKMPKKPGVNVKRVNKRKVNPSASKRATKRTRVDNMFIPAKDYTVGTSHVSELHKERRGRPRANDKDLSD